MAWKCRLAIALASSIFGAALIGACSSDPVTGTQCDADGDSKCLCYEIVDRSGDREEGFVDGNCRADQFDRGICCSGEEDCACYSVGCYVVEDRAECLCGRDVPESKGKDDCAAQGFSICYAKDWQCFCLEEVPAYVDSLEQDGFREVGNCTAEAVGCTTDNTRPNVVSTCEGPTESGSSSGATTGSGSGTCAYKEAGTTMAPCEVDSDCFSGFCDETGNPGPYCFIPQTQDLADLRGYDCASDADCIARAPDLAERGATIKCHGGDPGIYDGCEFGCGG